MTLQELIYHLESIQADLGPNEDPEVRLAIQPSYPHEHTLGAVELMPAPETISAEEFNALDEEAQDAAMQDDVRVLQPGEDAPPAVVYLGEGSWEGYLPGAASEALGWR